MTTFPTSAAAGATAVLGVNNPTTYILTARGWEVHALPTAALSADVGDVFDSIAYMRPVIPNAYQSVLEDTGDGADYGPLLGEPGLEAVAATGEADATLGSFTIPPTAYAAPTASLPPFDLADDGEFSTEEEIVSPGSPGAGPWAFNSLWRDPTDGAIFQYIKDSAGTVAWIEVGPINGSV